MKVADMYSKRCNFVASLLVCVILATLCSWWMDPDTPPPPLEAQKLSKPPSLTYLQDFKVIDKMAIDNCFPIRLLNDHSGDQVERIKKDNPFDSIAFSTQVLQLWLRGSGRRPATWKTLVDVLRECKLNTLADTITDTVSKDVMNMEPLPYSHSLEVTDFVKWLKKKYKLLTVVESPLLSKCGLENDLKFVNLTFVNATKGDHVDNCVRYLPRIRVCDNHLRMDQFMYELDKLQNKLVVITGDPGSGKTTLMRYLAREWAEGKLLQSCQILLLIYLGSCKEEYKSLTYLLKSLEYDDYRDIEQIAKMIGDEHGKGTCFLLDAYDERFVKNDFLDRLIKLGELQDSTCIITSRPAFADELKRKTYIKLIGFDRKYVKKYVSQLPKTIQDSIHHVWSDHRSVKEACQSPLYLSLVVYLVATDPHHKFSSRTQLYLGVMKSLVTHYRRLHPQWNAPSLRNCITQKTCCSDDMLCCAFTILQRVAFDVIFKKVEHFEMTEPLLYESIKDLSIVSIHPVGNDVVTYQFAHRTFAEYFAALYLTTLHQDELLLHVTKYPHAEVVWQFYFGLMGTYFNENITTVSTAFKYLVRASTFLGALDFTYISSNYLYCRETENHVSIKSNILSRALRVIQEFGSSKEDFFTTIVVNSSVIIDGTVKSDIVDYALLFKHSTVHKLCYNPWPEVVVTIEDWTQKLDEIHSKFAQWSVSSTESSVASVPLPETSSITYTYYDSRIGFEPNLFTILSNSKRNCLLLDYNWCSRKYDESEIHFSLIAPYVTDLILKCGPVQFDFEMLRDFSSLQTLDLFYDSTTNIQQVCSKLSNSSLLLSLHLFDLTCKHVPMYLDCFSMLEYIEIKVLNLSECTDDLLHHLSQNKLLKGLEIYWSSTGGQKLVDILPTLHSLEKLHLKVEDFTDSNVTALSLALKNLTLLSSLSLESDRMTDTSVRTLANALSSGTHQNLRKLKLTYNYVGKNISDFLSLTQLTGLTQLTVSAIKQYENFVDIVKVLQSLPHLTHVRWSQHSLTDEELDILMKVLSSLPRLIYYTTHLL